MSQELLQRLGEGDEAAARDVFERYVQRLTGLARSRLSPQLRTRIDADDVVMSAYRSFFLRARQGEFQLGEERDLWRLLVEITLHKLYRQTTFHGAQRRSTRRETADVTGAPPHAASREPPPEAAVLLADELAAVMTELPAEARAALEMRLQGRELTEIAQALQKSERTVRRWLDDAKGLLRRRFPEGVVPAERKLRRRGRPKPLQLDFSPSQAMLSFDDYRLLQQIGAGGAGKVYRALIKPSATPVAIKFMKRNVLGRRELVERFVNEAQLAAQLDHPGIMPIRGIGHTPNRGYFLVMDLCERGDLQRRITTGPIPLIDCLRWTTEAADAIVHAHHQGVLHCDLKPSNLLLADDDHIVVTDFGLARAISDSSCDVIAGTPAFLAPEQLDARWGAIGPHTDVYGLGATLYALLGGHPPHTGTVADILKAIAAGQAPEPLGGSVPHDIARLVQSCLAIPDKRLRSVAELIEALNAARQKTR
jgi:RNA polymerase sigma factor (sigma-70 family)